MDIEAIFCQIDDFCQHCEAVIDRGALPATTGKRTRKIKRAFPQCPITQRQSRQQRQMHWLMLTS
jgi:hypothetical protein